MEQKSAKKAKTIQTWYYLPPEILPDVLSHFDVKTLVEKKQVSKNWYTFCTGEIDTKRTKAFQTNKELNDAVRKYCGCKDYDKPDLTGWTPRARHDADLAEEFACTYGYPMNNWDVSKIEKTFMASLRPIYISMRIFRHGKFLKQRQWRLCFMNVGVSTRTFLNGMFQM